jgi:hypothetical protein
MRVLLSLILCVGCGEAGDNEPVTAESDEARAGREATTEGEVADDESSEPGSDPPPAVETTTGFIEATVGGAPKRFELLPANHNTAAANGTFLEARASAESDERFEFSLVHLDVRDMEFPATIRSNVRAREMAGMNYWDAEGTGHPVVFNDDSFVCQDLSDLRLSCTFSGTAHPDEGGPVEITDGRLEVLLTTNELRDRFIESTSGAGRRAPGR